MFPDDESFSAAHWANCPRDELRDLIMKFASLEAKLGERERLPLWKQKRKECVAAYQSRFGDVPNVFAMESLPTPFGSVLFDEELKLWW